MREFQIITFYEFRKMPPGDALIEIRDLLRALIRKLSIKGTIILAEEGFNSAVCGIPDNIGRFIVAAEEILQTKLDHKSSSHRQMPFRRVDVKIKAEIVTLKRKVDILKGTSTHVDAANWNRIISDTETLVLDARNDYEFRSGTFRRAVNPAISKFSDLPDFVAANLDPRRHKRVAMFCTGGIRCEKFAPFMKELGFEEVYQLKGGILKYLEDVSPAESLWEGECFVFDDRISLVGKLKKGRLTDFSQAAVKLKNTSD